MLILGLESSCDETAAAIVTGDRRVLSHKLAGQEAAHAPYGGVVPEIAARAHVEMLGPLIEQALAEAKVTLDQVDAIAATAGPGLIGGVMVGLVTGKALALAAGKPLIGVNHLEGHALSPRLADPSLEFPYLLLLVSGGHCQLLLVQGVGRYRRLATTIDDAAGEAFDKSAKLLGLGYPGGPAVERLAATGDPHAVPLPRPLVGTSEPHFSFAGLKSAVMRAVAAGVHRPEDIAASFQQAAVDCLVDRTRVALEKAVSFPQPAHAEPVEASSPPSPAGQRPSTGSGRAGHGYDGRASDPPLQGEVAGRRPDGGGVALSRGEYPSVALRATPPLQGRSLDNSSGRAPHPSVSSEVETHLSGHGFPTSLEANGGDGGKANRAGGGRGVAANKAVRGALEALAAAYGLPFVAPPLWLCTDNAAMIAWAGAERFAAGLTDPLDIPARPRWPLDPDAAPVRGAGVKA